MHIFYWAPVCLPLRLISYQPLSIQSKLSVSVSFFMFCFLLGGRQTCSITIWNDGQVGATYTSQNTFMVEWEGAGPVESFNCILRQDATIISSMSCKLLTVQYLANISTVMCTNSTSQAIHHLNQVLLILGITMWRFSRWGALVECKGQPLLDQ